MLLAAYDGRMARVTDNGMTQRQHLESLAPKNARARHALITPVVPRAFLYLYEYAKRIHTFAGYDGAGGSPNWWSVLRDWQHVETVTLEAWERDAVLGMLQALRHPPKDDVKVAEPEAKRKARRVQSIKERLGVRE